MLKISLKMIIPIIILSSSHFLYAETNNILLDSYNHHSWYWGASMGFASDSAAINNQITLDNASPPSIGNYQVNNSGHSLDDYGVFGGIQFSSPFSQTWLNPLKILLGLGVYTTSSTAISGQGNISGDNPFQFQYKLNSQRIVVESHLIYLIKQYFQPELYVAAGWDQISAKHFSNTAEDPSTTDLPTYADHRQMNFVASFGLGFFSQFNNNWAASTEYQYNKLGKASLGNSPEAINNPSFYAGHVNEQLLKFSIYYCF